jgi:hypothetical protein
MNATLVSPRVLPVTLLEFEMTDAFTGGPGTEATRPRLLATARGAIRQRDYSYRAE